MPFSELLAGQCWTEVRVVLAYEVKDAVAVGVWQRSVATLATTCRRQASGATSLENITEPLHLPSGQHQRFGRLALRRAFVGEPLQPVQPF